MRPPGGSNGAVKQVVGVVAGQKIPPVDRFAAGYEAGARAADPGVKVLLDYSQDFVDQAKCKVKQQLASGKLKNIPTTPTASSKYTRPNRTCPGDSPLDMARRG